MTQTDAHEDLTEYRHAVRSFVAGIAPTEITDRPAEASWKRLALELGAAGLLIPEEHGGAGSSLSVALGVLGELGGATVGFPYLTTAVLAPCALNSCPESQRRNEYLEAIAAGRLLATVATSETSVGAVGRGGVKAIWAEGKWVLDGLVDVVLEAQSAQLLLVRAEFGEAQCGLFAVPSNADGLGVDGLATLDLTRRAARVEFRGTTAQVMSEDFTRGRAELFDIACAALSAEMAGAAGAATEMAVQYAGIRAQFGALIGSQQLVQKLCADMFVVATSARSISTAAAHALSVGTDDAPRIVATAKAYTSEKTPAVGESNIQVHGGIGYTWEHPAHVYLRRLRADAQLFGDAKFHRRRLGVELGVVRG